MIYHLLIPGIIVGAILSVAVLLVWALYNLYQIFGSILGVLSGKM